MTAAQYLNVMASISRDSRDIMGYKMVRVEDVTLALVRAKVSLDDVELPNNLEIQEVIVGRDKKSFKVLYKET